jgi:hypothetical protein
VPEHGSTMTSVEYNVLNLRRTAWRLCPGLAVRKSKTARRFALALVGLAVFAACPAPAQEGIGSAAALRNQVEGITAGRGSQPLQIGSEVYQNELVRTAEASVVQLVFLDSTDLSVGPKSEVTLDRFVYDPDKTAGSVVVRAGQGMFRFVTGTQRKQNYLIATPIASIGVRGTIFDLLVLPDRVTVVLVEGEIAVTTFLGRVVALTEPGQSVTIFASGAVLGPRPWRGKIHVDFANADFPFFGSVPSGPPVRPAPPPVRHTSIPREPTTQGYGGQGNTPVYPGPGRPKHSIYVRGDGGSGRVDYPPDPGKKPVHYPPDSNKKPARYPPEGDRTHVHYPPDRDKRHAGITPAGNTNYCNKGSRPSVYAAGLNRLRPSTMKGSPIGMKSGFHAPLGLRRR